MDRLPLYIYFIVASFLTSLLAYSSRNRDYPYLKTFPVYLLLTLGTEALGNYLALHNRNNLLLYNSFSVVSFTYFSWIISRMIGSRKAKVIIRTTILFFLALAVINASFIQGMKQFHTITYSVGCLMIVAAAVYFFLELFSLPKSVNLRSNPPFWICSGLLFWHCCGFPLYGLINVWGPAYPLLAKNFSAIVNILNIFLYSLFVIGFLCIRTPKYISSRS